MTPNRKADLQRKLGMAPVPTPPPDLAQRIKSEIPHDLGMDVEHERAHLRRAVTFDVRIAASILLLVSATFAGLHLMTRSQTEGPALPSNGAAASRIAQTRTIPDAPELPTSSSIDERARALPAAPPADRILRRSDREEEGSPALAARVPSDIAAATGIVASNRTASPTARIATTPRPAPVAALETPTPASTTRSERVAESAEARVEGKETEKTMAASARGNVAIAADAAMPVAPRAIVAQSGDSPAVAARKTARAASDASFAAAEESARRHERLTQEQADALVEHFASASDLPARGLRFETEAMAMSATEPDTIFLRVSIDAAAGETATDLHLYIDSGSSAGLRKSTSQSESSFARNRLSGSSITRVYSIGRPRGIRGADHLASVRLRYRDENGQEKTVERTIATEDVHDWATASRRGQAASLTGALATRLKNGRPVEGLAAMARRRGLNELAELIEAASRP